MYCALHCRNERPQPPAAAEIEVLREIIAMGHAYVLVIANDPDEALYQYADYADHEEDENEHEIRFDYYGIAGEPKLKLVAPLQPGLIRRLFGATAKSFVSQARKEDIDLTDSALDDIAALVVDGEWRSCPQVADDSSEMKTWDEHVKETLTESPADVLVTLMDCHL